MSVVVVTMSSGAQHEIVLPAADASELTDSYARLWRDTGWSGVDAGRQVDSFNRTDGTCVLINPAFVESIEVR